MTPTLGAELITLYANAEAALAADDIEAAEALITAAGSAIAADPSPPDPALADLARACEDARRAVEVAMVAAHKRLVITAAAELRVGPTVNAYRRNDSGEARFVDRTG